MTTRVWLRVLLLFVLAGFLFGADDGGGCKKDETEDGLTTITLTDAASDELDVFEVDVTSLRFRRLSGGLVEMLPNPVRVDLVSLVSMEQMLVGTHLPVGIYTNIVMTVDFQDATVFIQGKGTEATIYDLNGSVLTGDLDIDIAFDNGGRPTLVNNRNRHITLDFDLNASVIVDDPGNSVTVDPVISAVSDPVDNKTIIATGSLDSVDVVAGTFVADLNTLWTGHTSDVTVATSGTTVFHLNGVGYTGLTGMSALNTTVNIGSRVWILGSINRLTQQFDAVMVEGGLGVPGGTQDWFEGFVTARTGAAGADPVLEIQGQLQTVGGVRQYNRTLTMTADFVGTKVLRRFAMQAYDTDFLTVGQRIAVFGEYNSQTQTFIATAAQSGIVRVLGVNLWGFANGPAVGTRLSMDVRWIGRRHIVSYDFTGSGIVPSDVSVDLVNTSATGITAGTRVRAWGYMNAIGRTASDPDFYCGALINHSENNDILWARWLPANNGGISSATSTAITLNTTGTLTKFVDSGFAGTTQLPTTATIVPKALLGIYLIVEPGNIDVFLGFANYASAIQTRLNNGMRVRRVIAAGEYDANTATHSANVITTVMVP